MSSRHYNYIEKEPFFVVVCQHCQKILGWNLNKEDADRMMANHHIDWFHTVTMLASYETVEVVDNPL